MTSTANRVVVCKTNSGLDNATIASVVKSIGPDDVDVITNISNGQLFGSWVADVLDAARDNCEMVSIICGGLTIANHNVWEAYKSAIGHGVPFFSRGHTTSITIPGITSSVIYDIHQSPTNTFAVVAGSIICDVDLERVSQYHTLALWDIQQQLASKGKYPYSSAMVDIHTKNFISCQKQINPYYENNTDQRRFGDDIRRLINWYGDLPWQKPINVSPL